MSKTARFALIALCACAITVSADERERGRYRDRDRIEADTSRLAAVLHDLQYERVRFGGDVWRSASNEALALANRIYAETGGRPEARDIRLQVREMRAEVMHQDFGEARVHAARAMPFVHALSDWARGDRDRDRR